MFKFVKCRAIHPSFFPREMIVCQVQSERARNEENTPNGKICTTHDSRQCFTIISSVGFFYFFFFFFLSLYYYCSIIDCCAYVWELTHFGRARDGPTRLYVNNGKNGRKAHASARVHASSSNSINNTHAHRQKRRETERKSKRERIQKYQKQKYPHIRIASDLFNVYEMPHSYGWFGIAWWGKPQLGFFFFFTDKWNKTKQNNNNDNEWWKSLFLRCTKNPKKKWNKSIAKMVEIHCFEISCFRKSIHRFV